MATAADRQEIARLLASCALPTDDLVGNATPEFLLARTTDGRLGGVIGLERFGPAGLLRSLAVLPELRGSGSGQRLTGALEAHAHKNGVGALYLLTTTAAGFFQRLGYEPADRAAAPPAIRGSAQFRSLCPASAVCLLKTIGNKERAARGSLHPWSPRS